MANSTSFRVVDHQKFGYDFETITEEATSSFVGSDRSNSISARDDLDRTRNYSYVDLKPLLIAIGKDGMNNTSSLEKTSILENDADAEDEKSQEKTPEVRTRARAFCANIQELAINPANTVSDLDGTGGPDFEDFKYLEGEDEIEGSLMESFNCKWDFPRDGSMADINPLRSSMRPRKTTHMSFNYGCPAATGADEVVGLLHLFRKDSSRQSSKMLIVRKSYSCSNLAIEDENKTSLVSSGYNCDYRVLIEAKEYERTLSQQPRRKSSGLKLDWRNSIWVKKPNTNQDTRAFKSVSKAFQASKKEYIVDRNKLNERISSDPFIILASGTKKPNDDFTNIQWICTQKLIDEIISPLKDDFAFEEKRFKMKRALVMTYDIAYSSFELFEFLMQRFFIQTPFGLSPQEIKFFETDVKEPAQLRVLELLNYWIREREADFLENTALRQLAIAFCKFAACTSSAIISDEINDIKNFLDPAEELKRSKNSTQGQTIDVLNRAIINLPSNPKLCEKWYLNDNKSFSLINSAKVLFQFSPKEFAMQMTLIDSALHFEIRPWHMPYNLRNKVANDSAGGLKNDNDNPYRRFVEQTNFRTFFFVYLIIAQKTEQRKRLVVSRLIAIADECLKLKNYQGFCCIIGAMTNMAVLLQKIDWSQLPAKEQKLKNSFEQIYLNNKVLRNMVNEAAPPLVPSLVVVSIDIEKIISVPVHLEETKRLINFRSMEELVCATSTFFSAQKSSFKFQPNHTLLEFLQVDVLRLMILLNSGLNISKIQTQLQTIALKCCK